MQPHRPDLDYILDNIGGEMANFHNILNLNRSVISMIDDKLRRYDQGIFLWHLSQVDEEAIHLLYKREMLEMSKLLSDSFYRICLHTNTKLILIYLLYRNQKINRLHD